MQQRGRIFLKIDEGETHLATLPPYRWSLQIFWALVGNVTSCHSWGQNKPVFFFDAMGEEGEKQKLRSGGDVWWSRMDRWNYLVQFKMYVLKLLVYKTDEMAIAEFLGRSIKSRLDAVNSLFILIIFYADRLWLVPRTCMIICFSFPKRFWNHWIENLRR